MIFAQKFEFSSQNLCASLLKNLIFQPSEARLSSITQNWNKSLSFHNFVPIELTNFECPIWKLHTLNYNNGQTDMLNETVILDSLALSRDYFNMDWNSNWFFATFKPPDFSKSYSSIIFASFKVMHFCKVRRLWLKN